jgi:phenylacetate 2-hydroxylase
MVSAGLDTVPGNLIMGIAYLSSAHGQEIQQRAYDEIMKVYPDGDAWTKCLLEEKVPYVTALVREVLRFFTVIPICLPRVSIKDIKYQDAVIPAGTTFYMVCVHYTLLNIKANDYRMPGLPITTSFTSKTHAHSLLSGT